jgi:malate permease and related proteins
MPSYWTLLSQVLPVFALMGVGAVARLAKWITAEAENGMLKLTLNVLIPALIVQSVLGNAALREPSTLGWSVLLGFASITVGFGLTFATVALLGWGEDRARRTFAFAASIYNYGYVAIPVAGALFDRETMGVLLVFNVGVEIAIWTVGLLLLNRTPLRDSARKLINGPVCALLVAVPLNFAGGVDLLPGWGSTALAMVAGCALPLGLMLVGCTLLEYGREPRQLWDARWVPLGCVFRLGLLPLLFLWAAAALPIAPELRHVLVVQAAMPGGVLLIVIAKHYGGQPLVAVQVALGTTLVGIFTVPLWLRLGLGWIP